jgi:NAD(P)-dependent dehydrogenase (short-subunit alcohol dehydrogenase family)
MFVAPGDGADVDTYDATAGNGDAQLAAIPGSRTINTDVQFDAVVDRQALKRRLTPADTAAAVVFLATDGAAALTGQTLIADGGLILH